MLALGPALTTHVFSGNVPGVAVTSLIRALLVKSPSLGKTAHDEPVLPVLFAQALALADPALAQTLAILNWSGGQEALEQRAFAQAELVVVYGDSRTAASVAARAPGRVVTHGPRWSMGIVHPSAAQQPALIAAAARAVATFDQQGCVSPHLIFLPTPDPEPARAFAQALAGQLDILAAQLPRGRLGSEEAVAQQTARASAEFKAIGGQGGDLFTSASATVVLQAQPAFELSCLNRLVYIGAPRDLDALLALIRPHGNLLQSVALEGFTGPEADQLAVALAAFGATRITTFQQLPWPPPDWHHDGSAPLRELIRWVDWED